MQQHKTNLMILFKKPKLIKLYFEFILLSRGKTYTLQTLPRTKQIYLIGDGASPLRRYWRTRENETINVE